MPEERKIVALIFGGKSVEHEISVRSAYTVMEGLLKAGFGVVLVGVSTQGEWYIIHKKRFNKEVTCVEDVIYFTNQVYMFPGGKGEIRYIQASGQLHVVDVVFPLIHGTGGEDGSLQGYLELVDVPYVGCGVQASAACMDKVLTKRILEEEGLEVAPYKVTYADDPCGSLTFDDACETLYPPLFIKPARCGSSVGVSRVTNEEEYDAALAHAFQFDTEVLIEEEVKGRELECAVLGGVDPIVTTPGEIKSASGFYSYDEKYAGGEDAEVCLGTDIGIENEAAITFQAWKAFVALGCKGMARVDVFFTEDKKIIFNEVNTIPGFTSISMYPKLFEHCQVELPDLLTRLIAAAEYEHAEKQKLQRTR